MIDITLLTITIEKQVASVLNMLSKKNGGYKFQTTSQMNLKKPKTGPFGAFIRTDSWKSDSAKKNAVQIRKLFWTGVV